MKKQIGDCYIMRQPVNEGGDGSVHYYCFRYYNILHIRLQDSSPVDFVCNTLDLDHFDRNDSLFDVEEIPFDIFEDALNEVKKFIQTP